MTDLPELFDWRIRREVTQVSTDLEQDLGAAVTANKDRKHFLNEGARILGERASTILIPMLFEKPLLLYPRTSGSRSGDFDAVYSLRSREAALVLVQAKGETSRLGFKIVSDVAVQQGTCPYVRAIAAEMASSSDRNTSKVGAAISQADPRSLLYLKIHVPLRRMALREWRPIVETADQSFVRESVQRADVRKSRHVSVGPVAVSCFKLLAGTRPEAGDAWIPRMRARLGEIGGRPSW